MGRDISLLVAVAFVGRPLMGVHDEGIQFAVTDVETTGLAPERGDRIVEIAVIRVDAHGHVLDEYVTLLNPQRDLGRTDIHGVWARDVREAPRFEDVAGDIASRLSGAVFVAHNASFDARFIKAEFRRLGHKVSVMPRLCTMRLSTTVEPQLPSRKLHSLCEHFGLSAKNGHQAYDDARATAALLQECFRRSGHEPQSLIDMLRTTPEPSKPTDWPSLPITGRSLRRSEVNRGADGQLNFIPNLVARLPAIGETTPAVADYLDVLDRVLEDRRVTSEEGMVLLDTACELGLLQEQVRAAHNTYLKELVCIALSDGVLSDSEQRDLHEVRSLLGIDADVLSKLLSDAATAGSRPSVREPSSDASAASLVGKSVCITGTLNCRIGGQPISRAQAESLARGRGVEVMPRVTKRLDFLVVADPDSMSSKARKAREYGVRLLAEPVFWQRLGIQVE